MLFLAAAGEGHVLLAELDQLGGVAMQCAEVEQAEVME